MKKILLLSLTALFLFACNRQKNTDESTASSVSFSTKAIEKSTGSCTTKEDNCATVKFEYPFFSGTNAVQLNKFVAQRLGAGYMDTLVHENFEEVMQQFLDSYDTLTKQLPDMSQSWELQKKMEVVSQNEDFITLHLNVYEFAGGAHPNGFDQYFHYDLKSNQEVFLNAFLNEEGSEKMRAIAEEIFRNEFKLSKDISFDSAGFFFENGKFVLPANYVFTKDGIRFHYNDYEIRSHAEGPYDLLVPYAKFKDVAKTDGYLKNYFNSL